ncbi:MAG: amidohydrolase family protein [Acidobacteriaceae bacterium]|nr:amidohydrolase family protein [Acidobacteriaceae bacterium]MBV9778667.1 amidohydrolase family protein [Acidobacteriaceae bacterium]
MPRRVLCYCLLCVVAGLANAQHEEQRQGPASLFVKAGKLLDVRKGTYVNNAAIWIEAERIKEVGPISQVVAHAPRGVEVIDLSRLTVMPGLIDCHTHLMARFDDTPDAYLLGLATKSEAFRALEGAADARVTLLAGFTTVRDVENEGSMYADVALRDAIQQGLVDGPRMQVATRAIAAVGQYNPFGVSPDLTNFPTGAQMVSGVEEASRAVREQIGHGADLIKVYADWQHPTLTVDEMRVIVEEAHKQKRKVAAHATTPEGIKNAVTAGVDSIEHGHGADRQAIEMIKAKGIFLVPTVGVVDEFVLKRKNGAMSLEERRRLEQFLLGIQEEITVARELGVKMASGFDASSAGLQGKNAEELVGLVKRGLSPADAIRCATMNAAELLGWEDRLGVLEAGKYADVIGVEGDPLTNIIALQHVQFVMKGGKVKKDASIEGVRDRAR